MLICSKLSTRRFFVRIVGKSRHRRCHPNSLLMKSTSLIVSAGSQLRVPTHVTDLERICGTVPGRMPKLFEDCLVSFGWLTVELGGIDLFPHGPKSGLDAFMRHVMRDKELFPSLFRDRFVQFGRAAGGSYDPMCFGLKRTKDRDCPIVRIDHESVLIDQKPVVTFELAPSFRAWLAHFASFRVWRRATTSREGKLCKTSQVARSLRAFQHGYRSFKSPRTALRSGGALGSLSTKRDFPVVLPQRQAPSNSETVNWATFR